MRINKYLAQRGIASRRSIDELVLKGRIKVNGDIIELGYKLVAGDIIELDAKSYAYSEETPSLLYIALNKPEGISSTCASDDPDNIIDFLMQRDLDGLLRQRASGNDNLRLYPVGRLDKYSEGLIILTNDGDLANILTHPSFKHEKEYLVELKNNISEEFLGQFSNGIEIELDDGSREITRPCQVQQISVREFKVILRQGLNRQIRRMAEALANPVARLIRLRVAKLELGNLQTGEFKLINYDDII